MFILQNQISHKLETYESLNNFYPPPRKILETLAVSGFVGLATIASSVAVALPASAISFNLSYTTDNFIGTPFTVNALLTTSDSSPTPTAGQTYTITNISGTVNNSIAITGLNNSLDLGSFGIVNNQFKWDGGSNIALTLRGIGFNTADSNSYGIIFGGTGFNNGTFYFADNGNNPHISLDSGFEGSGGNVTASNLSLTPDATPVPFDFDPSFGLLALGGAWTVRKMIKKSKSVVNK